MIRILMCDSAPWNVPAFYRTTGPLLADREAFEVVFPLVAGAISWVDLARADVAVFSRPHAAAELRTIEACRVAGVKVWVDYDDDLFNVPIDNPTFPILRASGVAQSVSAVLSVADIVTVSTSALQRLYGGTVIPNSLPPSKFLPMASACANEGQSVFWRGSASHAMDVATYADNIAAAVSRNDASFTSYGPVPWQIPHSTKFRAPYSVVAEQNIITFFRDLRDAGHGTCVVPLVDTPFNRAKSNIAWLEATAVGALTVAPALPEFKMPGVLTFSDGAELEAQLDAAITMGPDERRDLWWKSRDAAVEITQQAQKLRRSALGA